MFIEVFKVQEFEKKAKFREPYSCSCTMWAIFQFVSIKNDLEILRNQNDVLHVHHIKINNKQQAFSVTRENMNISRENIQKSGSHPTDMGWLTHSTRLWIWITTNILIVNLLQVYRTNLLSKSFSGNYPMAIDIEGDLTKPFRTSYKKILDRNPISYVCSWL